MAKRDIVQFISLNDFKNDIIDDPSKLAEAVLGEVPDQLVGYMTDNGIKIGEAREVKNDDKAATETDGGGF